MLKHPIWHLLLMGKVRRVAARVNIKILTIAEKNPISGPIIVVVEEKEQEEEAKVGHLTMVDAVVGKAAGLVDNTDTKNITVQRRRKMNKKNPATRSKTAGETSTRIRMETSLLFRLSVTWPDVRTTSTRTQVPQATCLIINRLSRRFSQYLPAHGR